MIKKVIGSGKLDPKKRYLQIALNSTLNEARHIISQLPLDGRILIEAGTPFIKRYGESGIARIKEWYSLHLMGRPLQPNIQNTQEFQAQIQNLSDFTSLLKTLSQPARQRPKRVRKVVKPSEDQALDPYIVADLKMMDRGATEVDIAARGGASAAVALGSAPTESLDAFIDECEKYRLDSMIDMMNIDFPLSVLRKLKRVPKVVMLHRGVDEERFNKEKQLPLHEIRRIKGNYDIFISIAGGDSIREVQRAIFNDADIVVVWKSFYQSSTDTANLAEQFLREIR